MLDLPFLAAEEEEIGAQLPASAMLTEAADRTKRQEVCDSAGERPEATSEEGPGWDAAERL